jgi:SAM-dependent methyltransferase
MPAFKTCHSAPAASKLRQLSRDDVAQTVPRMEEPEITSPEFWSSRYSAAKTPWDLHDVPPPLRTFLAQSHNRGRVLIPGCGSGYEVRAFHEAGFDVTAVDFAPAAIDRARAVLGELAEHVKLADFFTYDFGEKQFDLIYERTFLCALPPTRWRDYVVRMAELLKPEGRLAGIFLYGEESDPPPFPMREPHAEDLFGQTFRLICSERIPESLPVFNGMEERWQEWVRCGSTKKMCMTAVGSVRDT